MIYPISDVVLPFCSNMHLDAEPVGRCQGAEASVSVPTVLSSPKEEGERSECNCNKERAAADRRAAAAVSRVSEVF